MGEIKNVGRAWGGERERDKKRRMWREKEQHGDGDREGQGIDKGRSEKKNVDGEGHL